MKDPVFREEERSSSPERRKQLRKIFLQRLQRKNSLKQSLEDKIGYESWNIF